MYFKPVKKKERIHNNILIVNWLRLITKKDSVKGGNRNCD
jgi:hypothetical protein